VSRRCRGGVAAWKRHGNGNGNGNPQLGTFSEREPTHPKYPNEIKAVVSYKPGLKKEVDTNV
jgi:hypothetical protein